jgi:hypothetical protein
VFSNKINLPVIDQRHGGCLTRWIQRLAVFKSYQRLEPGSILLSDGLQLISQASQMTAVFAWAIPHHSGPGRGLAKSITFIEFSTFFREIDKSPN